MIRYLPFLLLFGALFAACEDDESTSPTPTLEVPSTYNFENVSYSGQTQRLGMLAELSSYLKSANDGSVALDADRLRAMYANEAGADWAGSYDDSKVLRAKTLESEQAQFDELLTAAAVASQNPGTAAPGTAGVASSADGAKDYLVSAGGVEYAQVIEKGLMGALVYYQATGVYLEPGKLDVDNTDVEPGRGTTMQHHWDESFGYLGVPTSFPADTDGLLFWGKYANDRDALLGVNDRLMDGYLRGRAAIGIDDLDVRDEAIITIRTAWDEVVAGTAIHYLNSAVTRYDDPALRLHALSEAVAFIYSLRFSPARSLSPTQGDALLVDLGGSSDFLDMNLYAPTPAELIAVRDELAELAGLEATKTEL